MIKTEEAKSVATNLKKLLNKFSHTEKISWIRTGIHALDLAIGNGIPLGRTIEIFGTESGGKTMMALLIIKSFQKSGGVGMISDVETTIPLEYINLLGVNNEELIYDTPDTVEQVRDTIVRNVTAIREVAPHAPVCWAWDSIAATSAVGEWEKDKESGQLVPKNCSMGRRAAAMSDFFKHYGGWMSKENVTLIAVNQLRDKLGVLFGRKTDSPGGHALKYHSSVRIELTKGKKVEVDGKIVGVDCYLRVDKSKVSIPFRKAMLRIYWDRGFDPYFGLDDLLLESGRITKGKLGSYKLGEEEFKKSEMQEMVAKHPELLDPLP